jgi:hypothetical protein
VWEVIAAVRDDDGDLAAAAEVLAPSPGLVRAAVTDDGACPDEAVR